jgi:hypothetical protein
VVSKTFVGCFSGALEKEAKQRLRDIGDARVEIEQIIQSPNADIDADLAVHQSRTWRRRAQLAIAGARSRHWRQAGLAHSPCHATPQRRRMVASSG